MVSLLDNEVKNGLIGFWGKSILRIEHNRLQTMALAYTEGYVTNERLRYALNIHKADISEVMSEVIWRMMISEDYSHDVDKWRTVCIMYIKWIFPIKTVKY